MIDLYTTPGTAGTIVRSALELAGAPHRVRPVAVADDGSVSPEGYRDINPNALVPTIVDGDIVLYETSAILEHLADRFPGTDVAPPAGSPERVRFHFWVAWISNNPMAAFYRWFKADAMIDAAHVEALQAGAIRNLEGQGRWLEEQLAGREWLCGDRCTAADAFLLEMVGWAGFVEGLVLGGPNVAAHAARTAAHPAVARARVDED